MLRDAAERSRVNHTNLSDSQNQRTILSILRSPGESGAVVCVWRPASRGSEKVRKTLPKGPRIYGEGHNPISWVSYKDAMDMRTTLELIPIELTSVRDDA